LHLVQEATIEASISIGLDYFSTEEQPCPLNPSIFMLRNLRQKSAIAPSLMLRSIISRSR